MNASRVHAVIAAGLNDPRFLDLWQREPDRLRNLGVDPNEFDFQALWKFAGLTAKVRHNGLRADLPLTFRFLNVAGLEVKVFASYASFCGGRYAETTEKRTQDLLAFLEGWLDFNDREDAILWDLIRYEAALVRLQKLPAGDADASSSKARGPSRNTSVPRVSGQIVLEEMRCDPRCMRPILQEKFPRLDKAILGSFHFCFWRPASSAEVHILELDELGFYLLALTDGKRSAGDLSCLIGGNRRQTRGLRNALDELGAIGILRFDKIEVASS